MKIFGLTLSSLFLFIIAIFINNKPLTASPLQRLDEFAVKQRPLECSKGQGFWCQNLVNSKQCNATTHCIQSVWTKHLYPVDNDSICQICLDMVKQARDQLLSNETQSDLKAVFEGTCDLIRIKTVRKECDKLADDFVPELVEALSSQMNPQVVCSVAGLCNNAAIDKLLAQYAANGGDSSSSSSSSEETAVEKKLLSCGQCNSVGSLITQKFKSTNRDKILENMLNFCGELSTFSDGCSNIVLTYFNEIYEHLSTQLTEGSICHMSGVCADLYHEHNDEKPTEISIEVVLPQGDDIPCDLCKQLVGHLRDLLVANTTEEEFKLVLEGVCKQTKTFKGECVSIVDQYYDVIYNTLTHNLDENGACFLIGICPKGPNKASQGVTMPLVRKETKDLVLGRDEPIFSAMEIQMAQLPKDQLLIGTPQLFGTLQGNGQLCAVCEYVLHFVQESLASPVNEDAIKRAATKKCQKLPSKFSGECTGFVDTYGDAIIALLIQDIDPSQVCPKLTFCGTSPKRAPIQAETYKNEKCPLCLFLVQELEEKLKNDKSKENIKNKLDTVCDHLPDQLRAECQDFVHTYTAELVDKLADDFTPQQICVAIRTCTSQKEENDYFRLVNFKHAGYDIETNMIEDNTVNGQVVVEDYDQSLPECLMCEQIIKEVERKAGTAKTKEEIEQYLQHACSTLDKPDLRDKCAKFVEKNADLLVNAIVKQLAPKVVCRDLGFCARKMFEDSLKFDSSEETEEETVEEEEEDDGPVVNVNYYEAAPEPPTCALCELLISKLEKDITDKKTRDEIEQSVKNVCKILPKTLTADCKKFIDQYGELIINLIGTVPPKEICAEAHFCLFANRQPDKKKVEVLECAVCHAASQELQQLVKNAENKQNRQLLIEKTCNRLPAKYYQRCTSFLAIYLESVINLIEQSGELGMICEQIGMCYKNEMSSLAMFEPKAEPKVEDKPKKLVGANRCTYGPSYWCSDSDKMIECGAHAYCKTYLQKVAQQQAVEVMGV